MRKKIVSVFLVVVMLATLCVPAFATSIQEGGDGYSQSMETVESDVGFEKSYSYGLSCAETPYSYIRELLKDADVFYENEELGAKTYSMEISDELPIENAAEFIEIGEWDDVVSITYYSDEDEFVILQYFPDGRINTYVRNERASSDGRDSEVSLIAFYGGVEEVVEFD